MKTNEKMEILSAEELEKVLGGYDDARCKKLQFEASSKQKVTNWDHWAEDFYKYCV